MPTSFFLLLFFFTIAFSLSCTPSALSYAHSTGRRILHQPFFPLDSLPPSQPPSPSPPLPFNAPAKLPFSTTTPANSPFFPSYPSPPPPPSPSTFASFPANISSLILPQPQKPKPSSKKLLAFAISAVVSALVVLGIIVFYYSRRRRGYSYGDDKTYRSNTSNSNSGRRQNHPTATTIQTTVATNTNKLRTTSTSSEFLYLGTLVNTRNIDETNSNNAADNVDSQKLESPELRPLPPLNSFSLRQNNEVGSTAEEEEEEFYSPRGSLGGGRESSTGTESGSRRVLFAAAINGVVDVFDARTTDSSSSSSGSVSPARSQSLSVSPPATPSPRPKSPDSASVLQVASPPPVAFQNVRASVSASSLDEPPRISLDLEQNLQSSGSTPPSKSPDRPVRSPSLSPARVVSVKVETRPRPSVSSVSASPENRRSLDNSNDLDRKLESLSSLSLASGSTSTERVFEMTPVWSPPRSISNDVDRNVRSPSLSSASTSPERVLEKTPSPGILIDLDRNVRSPSLSSASTSPERVLEKTPSPGISNDLDRNMKATSIFSTATTPERGMDPNPIVSPRISNVSDLAASSPECGLRKSPDASPGVMRPGMGLNERISSVLEQPVAVSSPPRAPPPPPPPPPMPQKVWDSPVASTPTGQSIPRPPVLVPPSRPFVLQTPMKVSPIELPPTSTTAESVDDIPKPKLKPLHWDKVRASSDREMVWDQLRSSSFKLNEEMIETLFVVNTPNPKPKDTTPRSVLPLLKAENRVLDPKKAHNIAILLRALNVTIEEVCEALLEGNADTLGTGLLESLLKMAPTKEEERKLKECKDDSPTKLGHAENFLRAVLDVPFAFKRVNAMLYIANFESEVEYLKRSFETLEAACEELRSSRMFFKLLEAVLKTGNRMNVGTNRGDAHAFKLDTLLKLVDVKGADGKTTLLHFVVQEIIRSEGARLSGTNPTPYSTSTEDAKCRKLGLQVVSGLSSELTNVKKAAAMDSEVLNSDVSKLSKGIENIAEVVKLNETMGSDESSQKFSESMNNFMKMADEEIIRIQAQESVAMSLVKEITEYFHGNSAKEEAHPFRIFMVVRDFLGVLDRVCKEVGMINERTIVSSAHKFPIPVNPTLPQVFSGSSARKQYSSSDDESTSP